MSLRTPAVAVLATVIQACPAQSPTWTRRFPTNSPNTMHSHAMVFELRRARTLLFGGGPGTSRGTWAWDGSTWSPVSTANRPNASLAFGMVYDDNRLRTVLFGGMNGSTHYAETWEFDGTDWTQVTTAVAPSVRRYPGMAYDKRRRRVVLFGGGHGSTFADTWEYDGGARTWTQMTPQTSPPTRYFFGMAYDEARERVVLFGGGDNRGYYSDTWEYDGQNWTQRQPSVAPSPRWGHSMTYDPVRETIVLFGGRFAGTYYNDTWEWDGQDWLQIRPAASPPTRQASAMTYDLLRGEMVIFAGHQQAGFQLADTWAYRSRSLSGRFVPIGIGCGAPAATLAAGAGTRPVLGQSFTLQADRLPASANSGLMTLGVSRLTSPLDLSPLGMVACSLYHSIDLVVPFAVQGGMGRLSFQVPNQAILVSSKAFAQAAAGRVATNAGEIRIGDQ